MGEVLAVMGRMLRRALGLAVLPLALLGCSVGQNVTSPGLAIQEILIAQSMAKLGRNGDPSARVMALTQADVNGIGQTVLRAQIPNYGLAAVLFLSQDRAPYSIWLTPDNVSLQMRAGMIIGSRGVGADLVSVDDPRMIAVLEGREGPGPSKRVNRAFNGLNQTVATEFSCVIEDMGSASVTIVGRSYPTRHLRQTCTSPNENFVNDYWQQGRTVWKSRQWFNNQIGYMTVERLTPQ
jgi:hypothetical protein